MPTRDEALKAAVDRAESTECIHGESLDGLCNACADRYGYPNRMTAKGLVTEEPATAPTPFKEGAWIDEYHAKLVAVEKTAHACGDWGEDDDETYEQVYARLSDAKADLHNHVQGLLAELRAVASKPSAVDDGLCAICRQRDAEVSELSQAFMAGAQFISGDDTFGAEAFEAADKWAADYTARLSSDRLAASASPVSAPEPTPEMTIREFQATNAARSARWMAGSPGWTTLEVAGELCGEAGELTNICKKLRRSEMGVPGNKLTDEELLAKARWEVGDVMITLMLTASKLGIDLQDAVCDTFNAKSEQMGFPERLGRAASPASETAQQRRCHCQNPSHAAPMQTGVCDDCGGEIEHAVDRFLAAKFLAAASETPAPEPSEIEALRTQADEMRRLAIIPGSWRCDQCSFALVTVALNPHTGATGAQRVVDSDELRCPNDGAQLRSATWKERVADMAALIDRQDAELARLRGDDAGTPEAGPPLTPELREAMAKIEADVRRLQYRGDRARPFPTIYDILAQTPEQGTDLPRAITSAMFGNGYLLSEHRRLLAIALVSAIGALLPRSDRGNEHAGSEPRLVERVAEAIYDAMRENDPEGKNRPWAEGGNSLKQDEASVRTPSTPAEASTDGN